jgi:hypothetical protein
MISIADLNHLAVNPVVAYGEYDEVRAEAYRRTSGPINPAALDEYRTVVAAHDTDWCRSVLGHDVPASILGRGGLPWLEVEMLRVAHERGLQPPMPPWLVQWKAKSAAARTQLDEARGQARQRDADAWAAALATCGVPAGQLEVRPNLHSRQVRGGRREMLRHVMPLIAVRSKRRVHQAGRALCEARRAPRVLGERTDEPATCASCLKYTAEIQPDETGPASRASPQFAGQLEFPDQAPLGEPGGASASPRPTPGARPGRARAGAQAARPGPATSRLCP